MVGWLKILFLLGKYYDDQNTCGVGKYYESTSSFFGYNMMIKNTVCLQKK